MKKSLLLLVIFAGIASTAAIMKEDGRAGATGSPGETTCNTSQCHNSFTLNSGGGSISISSPNLNNWAYSPGQTYQIDVTVSKTGTNLFGLGFEALRSTGANGGTLAITNPAETQIKSASVSGNIRANVVHQLNGGAAANSKTFSFNWTAPNSNIGNITFYAAGNAANNNGTATGDYIYSTSQVVTFATGVADEINPFGIEQVYPNPVMDQMHMTFNLTEPGQVTINLFSLQGKHICQLYSDEHSHGTQKLNFGLGEKIDAGIYFVELNVAGQKSVSKIVKI